MIAGHNEEKVGGFSRMVITKRHDPITGRQRFSLVDDHDEPVEAVDTYLDYLSVRAFSEKTVRAYAYDLLNYWRWLASSDLEFGRITPGQLIDYIKWQQINPDGNKNALRAKGNRGNSHASPNTINRRMAAVSGFYQYLVLTGRMAYNPVPYGQVNHGWRTAGRVKGLLGHTAQKRKKMRLAVKTDRRLPRGLTKNEVILLLASFKTYRDRALALLMLYSGLRSGEVLGINIHDLDLGLKQVRVLGKGRKERMVPLDDTTLLCLHRYLLRERPETEASQMFVVLKGARRGEALTSAGLRAIFRYHRLRSGITDGHPHRLRHTFGTNMAEAGVDVMVLKDLMGHEDIDSTSIYIHLSPQHLRIEYDRVVKHLQKKEEE